MKKPLFGSILMLLVLTTLVLAGESIQSLEQITLKSGRTLDETNAISITQEQQPSTQEKYYILQFPQPIPKDQIDLVNSIAQIDGYLPPYGLILKASEKELSDLLAQGIGSRIFLYTDNTNFDPNLKNINENEEVEVYIKLFKSANDNEILTQLNQMGINILGGAHPYFLAKLKGSDIRNIASIEGIEWIHEVEKMEIFNSHGTEVLGARHVWEGHQKFATNQIIAIADTGLDTGKNDESMHDDLEGRIISITDFAPLNPDPNCTASNGPDDVQGHGTHVTGSAYGNGILSGSNPPQHIYGGSFAGSAPESNLVFQALGTNIPSGPGSGICVPASGLSALFQPAYDQGARIHSNSWGCTPCTNSSYNINSQSADEFIYSHKDMTIVFSAGNSGPSFTSVKPPATAKNVIAVGASQKDPIDQVFSFSSRGATNDGRIKPDIIAEGSLTSTRSSIGNGTCSFPNPFNGNYSGCAGTSMAAPLVAGASALIREYYEELGFNPSSALVKATILNGGQKMIYPIASNESGWGRLNLSMAVYPDDFTAFFKDWKTGLSTGDKTNFKTYVKDSSKPLRITLVWTDPAAASGAQKTLINDLNLIVTAPDGSKYNGNDFVVPFNDELDYKNNVERVEIPGPATGVYKIEVSAFSTISPQDFAVVASHKGITLKKR